MRNTDHKTRCHWRFGSDAYAGYHDQEWGVPAHDERTLFERLILERAR